MYLRARSARVDEPADGCSLTQAAMGTVMAHVAYGPTAEACLAAVRREIERIEALLSRFRPDSEISRVNRSAGGLPVPVSLDTYEVLAQAVAFSRLLPGCFDVTVGPLVRSWHAAGAMRAVGPGSQPPGEWPAKLARRRSCEQLSRSETGADGLLCDDGRGPARAMNYVGDFSGPGSLRTVGSGTLR